MGNSSSEEEVSVAKPLRGTEETETLAPLITSFHGRREGERKASGLEKGCESRCLRMEMEQERAEGEVKNSPGSVGGWGGTWGWLGGKGLGGETAGLGGTGLQGAHRDGEALGDSGNSWFGEWGGNSLIDGPGMAMGTAGMGSWGEHIWRGEPWVYGECSRRDCAGLAVGTAGFGLGERLGGRPQ